MQGALYRGTVFADDVGIVAFHLTPVDGRVHLIVERCAVECTEASEGISTENDVVGQVIRYHCLGPVHHGNHVEAEHMVSQLQRVTFVDDLG